MFRRPATLLLCAILALIMLATTLAYAHALPDWLSETPGLDKVMHFTLFGVLTLSLLLSLGDRRWRLGKLRIPLVVVVPLLLASIEEGLQSLSPYRHCDILDLLCDAAGMWTFWWLGHRLPAVQALSAKAAGTAPPRPGLAGDG